MTNVGGTQIFERIQVMHLFVELKDEQIAEIATWFTPEYFQEGEVVFSDGDLGDRFYIILQGRVGVTRVVARETEETAVLEEGDFFGEEALLFDEPRSATVTAAAPVTLLRLDREQFDRLLRDFPEVRANLFRAAQTRRIIRSRRFDWLREDEIIHQIARKHVAILFFYLLGPLLVGLLSGVVLFQATAFEPMSVIWLGLLLLASFLGAGSILWAIWGWIDWGNDYYIVTDQRAVWIEKVIALYESRDEAPLNTILAVNVRSTFIGRILGYGDVIVRTFTGQITFRNVGDPKLMADAVEEYWHRAQRRSEREEARKMEQAIQEHLGLVEEEPEHRFPPVEVAPQPPPPSRPPKTRKSLFERLLGNFFQVRIEEGDTITYRKYWTVLVRKTWVPSLGIMAAALLMAGHGVLYFLDLINFPSPLIILPGGILLILILLPWWIYQYVDWRNDIYQVTDRHIFDIERRPLGTEVRKSAPLESILSLEHRRVGLLGYLLNYGNVSINVGDARFVFIGVHDPARVQQDIFNRMYALRRKKQEAEAAQERERIAEAITMYHRNIQDQSQRRSPFGSD
ncbi:MAG TPA: cyclic nucleotide-binding domain-containing protein [Anaerolineales bacterium]